ncbi:transcriptional regulator (plasmid) [Achromobacter xylosoxidans]|uniref:helix-turn-helix domain-containing protein n=1 Tax=Alcaligenes xylosoxydans xylosoxydans TaxID=85698 RepID=UPI000DD17464|nr:helix-turn-helix transcriptional regulator [Achromobacter xylosoxidans]AXA80677.1 transcriptional regulator [Achromobacter xylosoxidans]
MSTLSDVARMLKAVRKEKSWSQDELARRAGVARTTLARMETMARGDMSVSVLLRLLDAAGYDLKVVVRPFDQGLAPEATAVDILGAQ